jgi:hypothetical protein
VGTAPQIVGAVTVAIGGFVDDGVAVSVSTGAAPLADGTADVGEGRNPGLRAGPS